MARTIDKPEDMLAEALRCEELSRVSSKAGDFRTAAFYRKETEWFLGYAARLENGSE